MNCGCWPRERRLGWLVLGLAGLIGPVGCDPAVTHPPQTTVASPVRTREVRIAAAADLKHALDDLVAAFQSDNPEVRVRVTYGASGKFFAQISQGGPFDLFLSADVDYPRSLAERGLATSESLFVYAVGQIVVWVPESSPLDLDRLGIQAVVDPSVRKVAIANPRHAPYGRSAEAALKALGVYEAVQDRLVLGENVAQTAQFVGTGAADVGIIALSLAVAPTLRDKGRFWVVPLDAYPTLEQGGVVLSQASDPDAAEQLRQFLVGPEGRAILERHGFLLPSG